MEGWRRREEEKMEGEEEEKYDVDNFGADGGPLSVRGRCARGAQHGTSEGGKAWGPVKAAFRSRSAAQDSPPCEVLSSIQGFCFTCFQPTSAKTSAARSHSPT